MNWIMWALIAIPFSIGFAIMLGLAISEHNREAPVDTYRRLRALQDDEPRCPICGQSPDIVEKSGTSPVPVAYGCSEHGVIRRDQPRSKRSLL